MNPNVANDFESRNVLCSRDKDMQSLLRVVNLGGVEYAHFFQFRDLGLI